MEDRKSIIDDIMDVNDTAICIVLAVIAITFIVYLIVT